MNHKQHREIPILQFKKRFDSREIQQELDSLFFKHNWA
jgi:hypothetical protein